MEGGRKTGPSALTAKKGQRKQKGDLQLKRKEPSFRLYLGILQRRLKEEGDSTFRQATVTKGDSLVAALNQPSEGVTKRKALSRSQGRLKTGRKGLHRSQRGKKKNVSGTP